MSVSLLKNERKDLILRQINIHTRVTFSDLSRLTNVSEDTIRRDLNELAIEKRIIKVRGGAMVSTYHPAALQTEVYALDNKNVIAHKALKLLHNDMFVLIGGGTTVREFIRMIPDTLNATFITVNPFRNEKIIKGDFRLILFQLYYLYLTKKIGNITGKE